MVSVVRECKKMFIDDILLRYLERERRKAIDERHKTDSEKQAAHYIEVT